MFTSPVSWMMSLTLRTLCLGSAFAPADRRKVTALVIDGRQKVKMQCQTSRTSTQVTNYRRMVGWLPVTQSLAASLACNPCLSQKATKSQHLPWKESCGFIQVWIV